MIADRISPYWRHRELVDAIERDYRVSEWRAGDIDLWPLASVDLFLDIFRGAGGDTARRPPPFAIRAATALGAPAANLWKSRRDLAHWVPRPYRADAVLLGDGVSLDRVDGSWCDRFGDPIAAALERLGRTCFIMQPGDLTRLPWARPTFAANRIAARSAIVAALRAGPSADLPDHAAVMRLLEHAGEEAPSLSAERLARRARLVAAQAAQFDRILQRVQPITAFVTTYYAGLGHAFALACRRLGILCIDLQHCPRDVPHRAYSWAISPIGGYSTVPELFWTWSCLDAEDIRSWSDKLRRPWPRAIVGGHPQIAALQKGDGERLWHHALRLIDDGKKYDREILVALQPIGGKRDVWAALAEEIVASPATWRWWIRRHPASTPEQDGAYASLLSLRRSSVIVGAPSQAPLPALLAHMDALVSLASGAAAEAAILGVPAFFMDTEAYETFPRLIESGKATVVPVKSLGVEIARLPPVRSAPSLDWPPIETTLAEIDRLADDYARMRSDTHRSGSHDRARRLLTRSIAAGGSSISVNRHASSELSA